MSTILVPTDYSPAAANATEYAASLAKRFKSEVFLFHSFHVPFMESEVHLEGYTPAELQLEHESALQAIAAGISSKYGVAVSFKATMGFAADTIIEEEKHANLVVMGMKAYTGAGKILGSIATSVLKRTKKPLLIIPEKSAYKDPENVVLACDEKAGTNEHPINTLKNFLKPFRTSIHVLNIRPVGDTAPEKDKMKKRLNDNLQGSHLFYHFFENENLVETLSEFVSEHHADMMAIIPHHYHILDRLFHKSVSREMAFTSGIPLLALPETQSEGHVYFF